MTDDHWGRIKQLFTAACSQEPGERETFVRQQESDQDIVEAVLALLAHDNEALVSPLAARVGALEPGELFGPYRVVGQIGQGGMGVLYLAERSDGQFHQRVAIKLLRPSPTGGRELIDAMREQRLLARLDHPNIARIIDAGIADTGQSYIVMDYVDGTDLIDYCRNHDLSLDDRLALFRKVCAAVSHAHRNLVLHRDLKPDNILVTEDGEPRLVDFGVARLLERTGTTAPTTATVRGYSALTPEYASPEQIRGEPLTTGTDVYALGVTLYELLTGERPYRFVSRSPEEVVRIVTDSPVEPPSRRVTGRNDTPVTARLLRGDLDMIVAQAMHRDPQRRYPSVEALADDIQRFARGLPVTARADSAWYRVRKFVRRQRLPVGVAAVALLFIAGGVAVAWTNHLGRLAEAERAQSLSRFMLRMFDSVTPTERQGEPFTVSRLLNAGAERAEVELADQPELKHRVLLKIADTYLTLGERERASGISNRIEKNLAALPGDHLAHVEARSLSGDLQHNAEDWPGALATYESVLTNYDAHPDADRTHRLDARVDIARTRLRMEQASAAEPLIREALNIASQPPELDPRDALTAQGSVHFARGEFVEALAVITRIIDEARRWDGDLESITLAGHHYDASITLTRLRRIEEAAAHIASALAIVERLEGSDSPRYARYLIQQANMFDAQDRYPDALKATARAVEILRTERPGSEDLEQALGVHSGILMNLGRRQEAIAAQRELLENMALAGRPDAWVAVITRLVLSATLLAERDIAGSLEAAKTARTSLERSSLPPDARHRVNMAARLAAQEVMCLTLLGEFDNAVAVAEDAHAGLSDKRDDDLLQVQSRYILTLWEGVALERLGRMEQATASFTEAERLNQLLPSTSADHEREYARRYRETGSPFPADDSESAYSDSD